MYPSVKQLPISKDRAESIKTEIVSTLYKSSESRELLIRKYVNDSPEYKSEKFVTVGLNSILDRIWFVDNPSDQEYYSCQGIGVDIAESIAESETKYITSQIIEKVKTISYDGPIKPWHLKEAANLLANKKADPDLLLMNIRDNVQLWHYNELAKNNRICIPSELTGLNKDIEIQFFRLLPEGISIMVDSKKLGSLLVKKKIEETTVIQEIGESEYEKLFKALPELRKSDLREKVRVLSYETIKVIVENPEAGVTLKIIVPKKENKS